MPAGHDALVDDLVSSGVLRTAELVEAFRLIDRANFVLPEYKPKAYANKPLPIGFSQTISQPYTVAFMLELLQPKMGHKVLEIGVGSGWQTTMLASVVGAAGSVIGMEVIPELCDFARGNIAKYDLPGSTSVQCGNAMGGWPQGAPYDRIIAAATGEELPAAWLEQLKEGGVLVAPVQKSIIRVYRSNDGYVRVEHPGFAFVPLV